MSHYQGAAKISSFEPTDVPDFHKTILTAEETAKAEGDLARDRTVSLLELAEPTGKDLCIVSVYSDETGNREIRKRAL